MLNKKQSNQKTYQQELIEKLIAQNTTIKLGFDNLKKEYGLLRKKYQALCDQVPQEIIEQINQKFTPTNNTEQQKPNSPRFAGNWDEEIQGMHFQEVDAQNIRKCITRMNSYQHQRGLQQTFMELRNTNLRLNRAISVSEKAFPLIEGCFILQKKPLKAKIKGNINQMTEFAFPEDLIKHEKQAIDLMLKYTFENQQYHKINDDQFHSRRNEILYGTPYKDYSFAFEDTRWNNKKQIPQVLKQMGTMKKKYYHILVRPEILQKQQVEDQPEQNGHLVDLVGEEQKKYLKPSTKKQQKQVTQEDYFYETEVVYCVISSFPLRIFFQDLHRIIQQQLKYRLFNQDITDKVLPRKQKYQIIGQIMKSLLEQNYHIGGFPIFHTYHTGVTKLELSIPTVLGYQHLEDQYLRHVLPKYNEIKIIKLLHYMLAERFIIVEADSRRQLNEIFQILRILIRPFLWLFAIVYVYSQYFGPFLSSPMPILVGKLSKYSEQYDDSSEDQQQQINEDHAQFLVVKMSEKKDQLKDSSQPFYKDIKKLKKHMQKAQDKVELLHRYVNHLRNFIEKGSLDQEPTDFHMEFIDTQMVSYYKDSKTIE